MLAAKELLYVHYQMDVEMRHLFRRDADGEEPNLRNDHTDHPERPRGYWLSQRIRRRSDKGINYWQKPGQLFTKKRVRRAMGTAVVCMIGQQLCGVNVREEICRARSTANEKLGPRLLLLNVLLRRRQQSNHQYRSTA